MRHFLFLSLLLTTTCCRTSLAAAVKTEPPPNSSSSSSSYSTRGARRERNLDHWDADTLAYYLGIDVDTGKPLKDAQYVGHDAAIMFYAQWCRNCHALAPSWDAIATHLQAGTVQSNLIMALFDCDLTAQHNKLCTAVGIKHYPTLMFVGSGPFHDTDKITSIVGKDKSAGPAGAAPIPRTVKFQGNWQYVDSILDWIRTMQGLSRWHQWTTHGFLRFMREGILKFVWKKQPKKGAVENLPVGIPMPSTSSTSTGSRSSQLSTPIAPQEVSLLETKLKDAKEETKKMTKLATHASLLISSTLFPPSTNKTSTGYVDVFRTLSEKNVWNDTATPELQVRKACIMELALDYCSRLTTKVATDYVDSVPASDMPPLSEIETLLQKQINETEPYCGIMDECVTTEFKPAKCRPPTCPFQQDVACRYLTSCTEETIQKEYAIALGYITEKDTWPPPKKATATGTTTEPNMAAPRDAASGGGGWGMKK